MSWLASDAVWLPSLVRRGKGVVVAENQPRHHISGHRWLTGGSCWRSWALYWAASVHLIPSSTSPHYLLQVANFAEPVSNCR